MKAARHPLLMLTSQGETMETVTGIVDYFKSTSPSSAGVIELYLRGRELSIKVVADAIVIIEGNVCNRDELPIHLSRLQYNVTASLDPHRYDSCVLARFTTRKMDTES